MSKIKANEISNLALARSQPPQLFVRPRRDFACCGLAQHAQHFRQRLAGNPHPALQHHVDDALKFDGREGLAATTADNPKAQAPDLVLAREFGAHDKQPHTPCQLSKIPTTGQNVHFFMRKIDDAELYARLLSKNERIV